MKNNKKCCKLPCSACLRHYALKQIRVLRYPNSGFNTPQIKK